MCAKILLLKTWVKYANNFENPEVQTCVVEIENEIEELANP